MVETGRKESKLGKSHGQTVCVSGSFIQVVWPGYVPNWSK